MNDKKELLRSPLLVLDGYDDFSRSILYLDQIPQVKPQGLEEFALQDYAGYRTVLRIGAIRYLPDSFLHKLSLDK